MPALLRRPVRDPLLDAAALGLGQRVGAGGHEELRADQVDPHPDRAAVGVPGDDEHLAAAVAQQHVVGRIDVGHVQPVGLGAQAVRVAVARAALHRAPDRQGGLEHALELGRVQRRAGVGVEVEALGGLLGAPAAVAGRAEQAAGEREGQRPDHRDPTPIHCAGLDQARSRSVPRRGAPRHGPAGAGRHDGGILRGMSRVGIVLAGGIILAPTAARAANGILPRSPTLFPGAPCMLTVDKAKQSTIHFDYMVGFEDAPTNLTMDELDDSRTHQFFALDHLLFDSVPSLPNWITQSDFDRAATKQMFVNTYGPEDFLETSTEWGSADWVRITPDDARLPISNAQAAMGFDWDISDVAPGTWIVLGYTFEPENNKWSPRRGAVRIIDSGQSSDLGPSAWIYAGAMLDESSPVGTATQAQPYEVPYCVVAAPGSKMTASWGLLEGVDEPDWVPFVDGEDVPADGDHTFTLEPPSATADSTIKLRLVIDQPDGSSIETFSVGKVQVIGDPNAPPDDPPGGHGCSVCAIDSRSGASALALLVLVAGRRRRGRGRGPA